jgi:hypothetical protein
MTETNRQLLLRHRPTSQVENNHFELVTSPRPEPGDDEVLLETLWLSFDPAQRGWLNDVRSYVPPVAIGEPMRACGIGELVSSNAEAVKPGDLVHTMVGWQDYAIVSPRGGTLFEHVPAAVRQPEMMLGLLGMTGSTAYLGRNEIGRPVEGDAVIVTADAGATGSIAGQIARIKGAASSSSRSADGAAFVAPSDSTESSPRDVGADPDGRRRCASMGRRRDNLLHDHGGWVERPVRRRTSSIVSPLTQRLQFLLSVPRGGGRLTQRSRHDRRNRGSRGDRPRLA